MYIGRVPSPEETPAQKKRRLHQEAKANDKARKMATSILAKVTPALAIIEAAFERPEFPLISEPIKKPMLVAHEKLLAAQENARKVADHANPANEAESCDLNGKDHDVQRLQGLLFWCVHPSAS